MTIQEFIHNGAKPGDTFYRLNGTRAQRCEVIAVDTSVRTGMIAYKTDVGDLATTAYENFIGIKPKDTLTEAVNYFARMVDEMKERIKET